MKKIRNILYMLHEIWTISKLRIFLIFILAFVNTANMLVSIYFFKFIIDGITLGKNIPYFITVVAIRLGVLLISQCCENFFVNLAYKKLDLKIKYHLSVKLYRKVKSIDLSSVNNADFFDKYQRAINEVDARANGLLSTLSATCSTVLSLISLILILVTLDPVLIIISVVGMLITVWANIINTKKVYQMDLAFTRIDRTFDYIKRIFYLPQYAKDIRKTNLSTFLQERFKKQTDQKQKLINKHWPPIIAIAVAGSWLYNLINVGIAAFYLAMKTLRNQITIGDFTAMTSVINNLSNQMLQVSNIISQYVQHSQYIDNYLEVIDYKSKLKISDRHITLPPKTPKQIDIQDVCFCYSGTDKQVLKHICLTIHAKEKIAIVGENGAGKTTLIKLIQRLYDPITGCLKMDGIPYRDIDLNAFDTLISSVEQDFNCYALTLKQNIALASFNQEIDEEKVDRILKTVMLENKIQSLPKGLDTEYTTEFDNDGVELSGGQLQRLAIARALYADAGVIIMDEPSSALDPISEAKMFDLIYNACTDKTLIVISHKLSCVKDVDRILVMDNGEIVEEGNHASLMQQNGKYAEMFKLQSERYGNEYKIT